MSIGQRRQPIGLSEAKEWCILWKNLPLNALGQSEHCGKKKTVELFQETIWLLRSFDIWH